MATETYRLLHDSEPTRAPLVLTEETRAECELQALNETLAEQGMPEGDSDLARFLTLCAERISELEALELHRLRSSERMIAHYDRVALRIWKRCLFNRARAAEAT